MKSTHFVRAVNGSLIFLVLSACAGTGSIVDSPRVELTGVELTAASLKRQTFLLRFNVANPNPFPLPIKAVEYQVRFDDQKFASGETAGRFTVPASGEESFTISVDLDLLKSATHLASLVRGGLRENVAYELLGRLSVDMPLVKPVSFSSSGLINLTPTASGEFD
jgi:LEA14-like dessication related protein